MKKKTLKFTLSLHHINNIWEESSREEEEVIRNDGSVNIVHIEHIHISHHHHIPPTTTIQTNVFFYPSSIRSSAFLLQLLQSLSNSK